MGEDELREGHVTIKHLRDQTGQETIDREALESWFKNYLCVLN